MSSARFQFVEKSAVVGVQTAVQTVVLDGVRTIRKARKVESRLAERIEAEQGQLTTEALMESLALKRKNVRSEAFEQNAEMPQVSISGADRSMGSAS